MTAPYVNLSQHQLADLSILRDQKNYAAGYEYMRDIVRNERLQTTDTDSSYELLKLENWLDRAASINGNDGSFSSEFVRGATIGIRERLGNPLSEAEFQAASDALARTVLNDVITGFGIPSAKNIIERDVAQAVGDPQNGGLGLPGWGWAGTWGDILPPPLGLGGDYQSINGESVRDYAKNWMASASSQLIDGLGRALLVNWLNLDNIIDGDKFDFETVWGNVTGAVNDLFLSARNFVIQRDPLVLDLDGDGLELVGANGNLLFDHNADSIKTGTGWAGRDDGFLVRDLNRNGTIDTGRELFGVDTIKSNNTLATQGFDALRDLDSNADGQITSADAAYGELKVWQDANQDGISQSTELKTLAQRGITSIGLNGTSTGPQAGQTINNNQVAMSAANQSQWSLVA